MHLYLVRHGKAEASASSDAARELTGNGRKAVERVARRLRASDIHVDIVLHSTLVRARQTAEILGAAVGGKLQEVDWLGPTDGIANAERQVDRYDEESVMLVGHLPFMEHMASYLLTRDEVASSVHFSTGTVACFARSSGHWQLNWMLTPDMA